MKTWLLFLVVAVGGCFTLAARADDWPQWRGRHRDAKVTGFDAPKTWPKTLTEKWKVKVGGGDATPALVGDKLYVFSREGGDEVLRCLDAGSGKELWQDKYAAEPATPPAAGPHAGPRCSPAVADGKVVTLGVRGVLSCLDAATGKALWRKDDIKGWPHFFTSSSPVIVEGMCVAQLGASKGGAMVAYDLTTGDEKWKWTGDGPAYASPTLMTVGGTKLIVAETDANIVAVRAADGKQVWQTPFAAQGRGAYNAASPVVDGATIIYSGGGRGTTAVRLDKEGDGFTGKELWSNKETSVQFNTPVLRDGLLFGLSQRNEFFCMNAADGKTLWTAPAAADAAGGGGRGGRGGRGGGYGSIVDAGPVLLALTPRAELLVIQPSDKEFKKLASYKVADSATYAYPVVSGKGVYIKDGEAVTLWTID